MVRYTIDNKGYSGEKLSYTSTASTKLTSTTLNTGTITWDKLTTITRHTTTRDTIPGTTSTTRVDVTITNKGELVSTTLTTRVQKDAYVTFFVKMGTEQYTYTGSDGFKDSKGIGMNKKITESYTFLLSDDLPLVEVSMVCSNSYENRDTYTSYSTYVTGSGGPGGSSTWTSSRSTTYTDVNRVVHTLPSTREVITLNSSGENLVNFHITGIWYEGTSAYFTREGTWGTGYQFPGVFYGHYMDIRNSGAEVLSTMLKLTSANKLYSSLVYIGTVGVTRTTETSSFRPIE